MNSKGKSFKETVFLLE